MHMKLALKIRLYVIKNFLKSISFLKIVVLCSFFLSLFLIAHYINSYSASNINRFLLVSYDINKVFKFWALIALYFYFKTIINKNTFKFKGVYSYLHMYSNKNLNTLYLLFQIDKIMCSTIVLSCILFFLHGFSKMMIITIFRTFCIFLLISFSDFFAKMYANLMLNAVIKNLLLMINIIIIILVLIDPYNINYLLVCLSFIINMIIYKVYADKSIFLIDNKRSNKKIKTSFFKKIYYLLKRIGISKNISFVATKEIIQIYSEKIPLIYSILYGVIVLIILPIMSLQTNINEIYNLSYYIAISYALIGLSMNVFSRELKREWIYKIYDISTIDIIIGKFIGFILYGTCINIFYILVQKIMFIYLAKYMDFKISLVSMIIVMIIVFPISFFIGSILGSYFIPTLKYKYGSIDYSYNGAEVVILLVTIYTVSLPAYLYYNYLSKNIIATTILFGYQIILFNILKNRIKLKILEKEENYERKRI